MAHISEQTYQQIIEILSDNPASVTLHCDKDRVTLYTMAGKSSIQVRVNNYTVSNNPYLSIWVRRYGRQLNDGRVSGVFYSPKSALNHILNICDTVRLKGYSKGSQ